MPSLSLITTKKLQIQEEMGQTFLNHGKAFTPMRYQRRKALKRGLWVAYQAGAALGEA